MNETVTKIQQLLAELIPGKTVQPDTELVKSGILDSVLVTTLAMSIAEEFDIEMSPMELKEENFCTLNAMAAMTLRLQE